MVVGVDRTRGLVLQLELAPPGSPFRAAGFLLTFVVSGTTTAARVQAWISGSLDEVRIRVGRQDRADPRLDDAAVVDADAAFLRVLNTAFRFGNGDRHLVFLATVEYVNPVLVDEQTWRPDHHEEEDTPFRCLGMLPGTAQREWIGLELGGEHCGMPSAALGCRTEWVTERAAAPEGGEEGEGDEGV